MGIVWLVSEKRFLQEYHNHIRNTPLKFVNWFVDTEKGVAKMYITATSSSDVFCYIHKGLPIPAKFHDILRAEGMVLGIEKEDYGNVQAVEKMDEVLHNIKFNMVTEND